MARAFLDALQVVNGLVQAFTLDTLVEDDLPRPSPDPSGSYTYSSVTVDQYGRVLAASSGDTSDFALLDGTNVFNGNGNTFTCARAFVNITLKHTTPSPPGSTSFIECYTPAAALVFYIQDNGNIVTAAGVTLDGNLTLTASGPGLLYQDSAGAAVAAGSGVVYTGGGLQFSNGIAGLDANSARMGGRLFDNFLDIVGISATASSASDRVVKVYDIVECGRFRGAAGAGYLVFDRSAGSDGIYFGEDADTGNSYVRGTGRFEITAGGNSGARARVGGTIFDHYADAGNSTTTETDLVSDTIASSTLASNGDKLEGEYGGVYVSSATATRQIRLYLAGTAIFDTGALTLSLSSAWTMYVTLIRVSATVVRYMISFTTEGAALAAYTAVGELTGLTLSNSNILKVTGQAAGVGAATNDIVAKMASVAWRPAAA